MRALWIRITNWMDEFLLLAEVSRNGASEEPVDENTLIRWREDIKYREERDAEA